jgi:hypothetical protein
VVGVRLGVDVVVEEVVEDGNYQCTMIWSSLIFAYDYDFILI